LGTFVKESLVEWVVIVSILCVEYTAYVLHFFLRYPSSQKYLYCNWAVTSNDC